MRAGGGKQKGASFERLVCKRLSLWITDGEKEDVFWRSAMSGGRATVLASKGKRGEAQAGDISAVSVEGHLLSDRFFIECKFYRDLSLLSFFFGKRKGKLHDFWAIAKREAALHKKKPMLITKQNNENTIVLLQREVVEEFEEAGKKLTKEVAPIAFLVEEETYVYWFDDLFPLPKPIPKPKPTLRRKV